METNITPIKSKQGGRRAGSGNKKGCKNSGLFSAANPTPAMINCQTLSNILKDISKEPFNAKMTKGEALMRKLFAGALSANVATIAGLKSVEMVQDRLDGKVKPSNEELAATKESKQVIIINIPKKT